MQVTSPSGDTLEIQDPSSPTPGGVITVKDPKTGDTFDVANPLGADTVTLDADTYLRPVYETVAGARKRGEDGRVTKRVLVGYEPTDSDDPQAVFYPAGSQVRAFPTATPDTGEAE